MHHQFGNRTTRREAEVLGTRFSRAAATRADLDGAQTKKLQEVLTEEICAIFERMHATGTAPGQDTDLLNSAVPLRGVDSSNVGAASGRYGRHQDEQRRSHVRTSEQNLDGDEPPELAVPTRILDGLDNRDLNARLE